MGNKPSQEAKGIHPTHCIQQRDFSKRSWLKKNKMVNLVIVHSSSVCGTRSASKDEARKKELLCPLEELAGGERFLYLLINDFCAASDSFLSFAGSGLQPANDKKESLAAQRSFISKYGNLSAPASSSSGHKSSFFRASSFEADCVPKKNKGLLSSPSYFFPAMIVSRNPSVGCSARGESLYLLSTWLITRLQKGLNSYLRIRFGEDQKAATSRSAINGKCIKHQKKYDYFMIKYREILLGIRFYPGEFAGFLWREMI
ncbi:hypothetical protein CDAR_269541 [Caerostris darwini]|uniref:Uncharacterized protein n=1 Tax=Caerostris darwini TaxID=1538125 RepID=A0AAV4VQQ3_9ARAC|nr:hypothetical protein CDAR_269541 [Caerostris darwini]